MSRTKRTLSAATLLALALGLLAVPPAAMAAPVADCSAGTASAAARALVAEQATVASEGWVAGLRVATAVDPLIPPGIPSALLRVGDRWCTAEAFNDALPSGADAIGVARAFASVAGMPYLGDVVVSDVSAVGGLVSLTTTGGRHGAVSRWQITVDGQGVLAARFTSTGFAPGFAEGAHAGALEGITSLPGHTRTFARDAEGRVRIDATVADLMERANAERTAAVARAATLAGNGPGDDLKHTFPDGLTIKVSYGLSPYTPDTGIDTGVKHADRLRTVLKGVISKYNDFYSWGARDPFANKGRTISGFDTGVGERAGYINIDSPLAPVCLACAYLADAMEVHIAFFFPEIAPLVVPISYPDTEAFMVGVIGHEMVHSLQGGYSNGGGGAFTNAMIEGSARASESLHADAHNSFQTGSIHYVDSGNGCEGFENGRGGWISAQAGGPFNGHTYDACYFWWTYFAEHGAASLVTLLKAMPTALATSSGTAAARNQRLLDVAAVDGDGALDLARWGAAAAAGSSADGYTIPAGPGGPRHDWFSLLKPGVRAAALAPSQTVSASNAGVRAYVAGSDTTITGLPSGKTYVFSIVDRALVPRPAYVGSDVAAGEIVVVVAPGTSTASGLLTTS